MLGGATEVFLHQCKLENQQMTLTVTAQLKTQQQQKSNNLISFQFSLSTTNLEQNIFNNIFVIGHR